MLESLFDKAAGLQTVARLVFYMHIKILFLFV